MSTKFRMGKKLWILSSKKTTGEFNRGTVVGIDLSYHGLGFINEAQFVRDHIHARYKVAYVDVFTKRAVTEWLHESDLQAEKP